MLTLFCTDTLQNYAGRVSPSMLSDHDRMQLFFPSFSDVHSRERLCGNGDDACTWAGVVCTDDETVTDIRWTPETGRLIGTINMQMLPVHLQSLRLIEMNFQGSQVDIPALPEDMRVIYLALNKLRGILDFDDLPHWMEVIVIAELWIDKIVNICNLPETLTKFSLVIPRNTEKSIHIGKLPANDLVIDVKECALEGFTCEDESDADRILWRKI